MRTVRRRFFIMDYLNILCSGHTYNSITVFPFWWSWANQGYRSLFAMTEIVRIIVYLSNLWPKKIEVSEESLFQLLRSNFSLLCFTSTYIGYRYCTVGFLTVHRGEYRAGLPPVHIILRKKKQIPRRFLLEKWMPRTNVNITGIFPWYI